MQQAVISRITPAVVLAIALAGCADDAGADQDAIDDADETVVVEGGEQLTVEDTDGLAIVEGDEESRQALAEAAAASSDRDARTRFSTTVAGSSVTNGVNAEGVSAGDDLTVTMDVRGDIADALGATDTEVEVRVVDGTVYTRFPLLLASVGSDAEWITSSVDGLGGDVGALARPSGAARRYGCSMASRRLRSSTTRRSSTVQRPRTTSRPSSWGPRWRLPAWTPMRSPRPGPTWTVPSRSTCT